MKATEKIVFCPAKMSDMAKVMELVNAAIADMKQKGLDQWDEIYPCLEDFEEDTKRGEMYTGWIGEELVSIYTVNQQFDEAYFGEGIFWECPAKTACCIHRLCVHPGFQGTGTGRKTLLEAHETMKKLGYASVRLDVFSKNSIAVHMYEKEGYRKKGSVVWRKGKFHLMEKKL